MKKPLNHSLYLLSALAAVLTLSGCGNTLSGAKQDTANDAAKTQQAADQAGKAVATLPEDAASSAVTIPVKTAIIRDPVVADARNLVNVSGKDHVITLNGHVATADMKTRAAQDAQVVLKEHPGYKLVNALTVAGAGQ